MIFIFSLIVAYSENRVIGYNNTIPWNLPSDLKRFKELTANKKIVMGRTTFDSLPFILPAREHIVISRNFNLQINDNRVSLLKNIKNFIEINKDSKEEIFIIGGEDIYKIFLPYAKKIYTTEILSIITGDTFFPLIPKENFEIIFKSNIQTENNLKFQFINYKKKQNISL
ncbi:MAG: dihydrofolate reductase [Sarcina sp.]